MKDTQLITLKDVANAVGVSAMTVSLALRNHPKIPLNRRRSIRDMAQQMGYRPNAMATALVHRRWQVSEHPICAEMAWINCWKEPQRLRGYREFDLYWRGALRAAEEIGFRLEEFVVDSMLTFSRLEQILQSRNIRGILIPPHGSAAMGSPGAAEMDWSPYAIIRFGYSVAGFPAHVVTSNQTQGTGLAFTEIAKRGYERIGYVCHLNPSTHSRAGFLMAQTELPPERRLPLLELNVRDLNHLAALHDWIRAKKPDAILTEIAEMRGMLERLGYRVPDDLGLAATSVLDGNTDAGIYQNSEEIGRAAVETLAGLIYNNQSGIPALCREILVDARWQDGATLPVRKAF